MPAGPVDTVGLTGGYPRPVLSLALAALIATSSPITDEPKSIPAAFALRSYAPARRGAPGRLVGASRSLDPAVSCWAGEDAVRCTTT